uniref:Uncharacterized protein n=1 Tax=Arundo donax TaxID=35708 RepID=A0A0A9BV28_ARUDO
MRRVFPATRQVSERGRQRHGLVDGDVDLDSVRVLSDSGLCAVLFFLPFVLYRSSVQ